MPERAQSVRCPQCGVEFPLSEALTREIEGRLRAAFEARLAAVVAQERARAAEVAEEKARERVEVELRDMKARVEEKEKQVRALEAQELEMRRRQRDLEERERRLALEVERRIDEARRAVRAEVEAQAEEAHRLKLAEKDKLIGDMTEQLAELKRKVEQGSQQMQGEVQELELETILRGCFPGDEFVAFEPGRRGADLLQRVAGPGGRPCGSILWESKRTKHWSHGWIQKLKEDQRREGADAAVLVSQTLPESVRLAGVVDGVWVADFRFVELLATVLRRQLAEVAHARSALAGKQEKKDLIYEYLTGPEFRRRLEGVVEAFAGMSEDLEKERRAVESLWEKRRAQLRKAVSGLSGLYGDLQGIVTLPPVRSLELELPPGGKV